MMKEPKIIIDETVEELSLEITDNGCGMSEEAVSMVTNPFYTTRTTRSVGLGIPFLKLAAEQTGGTFSIFSNSQEQHPDNHGTQVKAQFNKNHLDFTPLGDIVSTVTTLIQGHPDTDFMFLHSISGKTVGTLDTREIRQILGDVSLGEYEVIRWIEEYLNDQYSENNL